MATAIENEDYVDSSLPSLADEPVFDNVNILSPRDMTVLVLGRTGSGKSTLINSFLHNGCKKAEEKRGVDSQRHEDIETHKEMIDGVGEIKMIDTNGLCDKEVKSDEIVKKLNAENIFPDLVLICINITERFDQNLIEETTNLQKFYGDSFWQHAVFIITFCNRFELELRDDKEDISKKEIVNEVTAEVTKIYTHFKQELVDKGIMDPSVLAKIPYVPVGRFRAGKNPTKERKLTTSDDWLRDFLTTCHERCTEKTKLQINLLAQLHFKIDNIFGHVCGTLFPSRLAATTRPTTELPTSGNDEQPQLGNS